jgi:guanylate kinase
MPPFKRKTLVLIGTQGVGRRTLKNRLVNSDTKKFGSVVPREMILILKFNVIFKFNLILDTSRPPRALEENGLGYWFIDREDFEDEIHSNNFLEYGEHNGNLYGTHLDSIRNVIKEGKFFQSKNYLNLKNKFCF